MSRSVFAAGFNELLGQAPLEYVTEWRMQKAVQLLQHRDKKLLEIATLPPRSVSIAELVEQHFGRTRSRQLFATPMNLILSPGSVSSVQTQLVALGA
jgi:transcriptional regulator GlxA family with amidase domain